MAYRFERSEKIEEEIAIGDDIIYVNLDVDSIAKEFNLRYNNIVKAEQSLSILQKDGQFDPVDYNNVLIHYSTAVVELFHLVFGSDNAEKILDFYEHNIFEISAEVFPFIMNVIVPKIQESLKLQRERLVTQYKQKNNVTKAGKMGY